MENWRRGEPDLSWMSFAPEAHGITDPASGWTNRVNGDRAEEVQNRDGAVGREQQPELDGRGLGYAWRDGEEEEEEASLPRRRNGGIGRERREREGRSRGFEYGWRDGDGDGEEEEEEEEEELVRTRRRRGVAKGRGRKGSEDYDEDLYYDGASSSSSPFAAAAAAPPPPPSSSFWWDGGERGFSFSPSSLGHRFQTRRKKWEESLERENLITLWRSSGYPRLQCFVSITLVFCLLALALILFLMYLSFAAPRPPKSCEVDKVILNFTARRIRLRGGRYISFREQGVGADKAQHSVIVVHDLLSSRLAGIPGISESVLEEFGVRLISYDRPGYGQSDPHLGRTYNSSAQDISDIADALGVVEKFWVFGFGSGGPHTWAAINYIPERLAGVALFAPAGNFYAHDMTKDDLSETWGALTMRQKWLYSIARLFPALLPSLLQKTLVNSHPNPLQAMHANLGVRDQISMEQPDVLKFWKEDVREALQQQCAFPMAEELILLVHNWGFSLTDLPFKEREARTLLQHVAGLFHAKEKSRIFSGPIHIWQGTEDQIVPVAINKHARRMIYLNDLSETDVPRLNLHLLEGEGHISWFWFCEECHRDIFHTLFQPLKVVMSPAAPRVFSVEDYEAILASFGGPKETVEKTVDKVSTLRETPENKLSIPHLLRSETAGDDDAVSKTYSDPHDRTTEMVIYVPESCEARTDTATSILKAIEKRVKKYIRFNSD